MKKCTKCGVMIEDNLDECPLCGEPVTEERRKQRQDDEYRDNVLRPGTEIDAENEKTVRGAKIWLFEMTSLVAFTAAIVIFAADFAFGFTLTWSTYPLLAIVFVYLLTAAIIALIRRPAWLFAVETVVVVGFLFLLDLLVGDTEWFLPIGLPVTILVALLAGGSGAAIVKLNLNALQSLAVVFLASGFFVVGLELVLNYALHDELLVSWSLIAFACTLSLFVVVLFINKRLRERHSEYKKIFHI
ncbi:MAG: DUF6320 domain-containing protein [Spirochaetota bacterium]